MRVTIDLCRTWVLWPLVWHLEAWGTRGAEVTTYVNLPFALLSITRPAPRD